MDPRDTYPRPPPTGDPWSSQFLFQWLFEQQHNLSRDVAALLANQQTNKVDIIEKLRTHRVHYDQRLEDFKDEIFPRLARSEARIEQVHDKLMSGSSKPEAESSLAKSLFGSIGVFLWSVIPWKHLGLMAPGILLAIAGNLAPEGTKRFIIAVVDLFWKTPSP